MSSAFDTGDFYVFFFLAACIVGFFLGRWTAQADASINYHKGHIDGINLIWPHYVRLLIATRFGVDRNPASSKESHRDAGAEPVVH